jgi:hypothetical protein
MHVVADLHHFDDEQDLDPHQSERLDPDPYHRIRMKAPASDPPSTRIR